MKHKFLPLIGIGILLTSVLLVSAPVAADGLPTGFPRNNIAPAGPDTMDLTVEMLGEKEIAIRKLAAEIGPEIATNASPFGETATIGEEFEITVFDKGLNIDYDEIFVVLMEGAHGIVLIEKAAYDNYDSGTGEYVFPNPNDCWRTEDRISTNQLSYLLDQFDTVIYPTDTTVFGEPLPRGSEGQKVWILIHNIRDSSYYDCTATSYVAGYFSANEDAENNKNMMHIDSYDWENRTGPDSTRPYLYESIFAHEFEHLVHFDMDPDEPSWVDEGLADLAGFLCGYGHPSSHLANYMVYHPVVSLTFWGNGLENYGASYLFQLYLFEKYGGVAFTSALTQKQTNGIEGIENTLADFGYSDTFNEIFDNWTIANYIDDTRREGGKYGYDTLQIGTVDTWGYTIEYSLENFWGSSGAPHTPPFDVSSYLTFGDFQPYTARYYSFNNEYEVDVMMDGSDFAGTLANSGTYEWYSDAEAFAWRSFYQTFDIPAGGATLNFYTFYKIEENWDYGYVEVYDQDTGEWYTLDALGTVDYVAYPQDNPNTPTGREPTDYEDAGRWHAFTGYSGGWVPVSMDLFPFAGHTIDIYFTTWQDVTFSLEMMYVDDISIPEIGFFDDIEVGEDGWTTTGWYVTDGIQENGFGVMVMDTRGVPIERYPEPAGNKAMRLLNVKVMEVDSSTQSGVLGIQETPLDSKRMEVVIITNHASHNLPSYYDLEVE